MQALQHRLRTGIGFLQLDTPIFQLLKRDRRAGDRTTHESARSHNAEIPVEIFDLCLTRHGGPVIEAVQHLMPPSDLASILTESETAADTLNR